MGSSCLRLLQESGVRMRNRTDRLHRFVQAARGLLSGTFLGRAARDQRGVSAVAVAITFAVLAPMALGVFDVFSMSEQRGKLQDALDAAALYAARSPVFDTPGVNAVGNKALVPNLQLIH